MAAPPRYRIRQTPTDVWSTRERLCLASSVLRSGDQNWVSVSRAIKPFGEPNRPPDWFSQKNCALQYSDLLEKVEAPKRKRWERADKETPGDLIVRKLTIERMEELKKRIQETQIKYKKKKREVEIIRSGHCDDQLDEIWNRIKEEVKAKEASEKEHKKWLEQREARIVEMKAMPKIGPVLGKKKVSEKISRVGELRRRNSSQSELSEQDSAAESPISESPNIEVEDAVSPASVSFAQDVATAVTPTKVCATLVPTSSPTSSQQPTPSTSPLLTSLLKSPTPTTPVSPIASGLVSPVMQPKEGPLATPHASPRSTSAPQSFFNPSSALATAAARQLAVATSSVTPSLSPYSDKQDSNSQVASSVSPAMSAHSVTLSAPTLSKLLEMPPSIPGKLPPLPIVHSLADKVVPASTIENESSEVNTVDQVLTSTVKASLPIKIEMDSAVDTSASGSPSITLNSPATDTIEVQVKMEIENDASDVTSSTDLISEKEIESNVILESSVNSLECTSQDEDKNGATCTEASVEVIKVNTSVLDNKDDVESQELQQVILMEVDFTGDVKDGKGKIIEEVFELTAAEGSIVELEYETICDDEIPIKEAITEVSTDNKSFSEAEYASEPIDVLQNVEEHKENHPIISVEEKSVENTSPCENVDLVKEVEAVNQAFSPVQVKAEELSVVSHELESSYVEFKIPDRAAVSEDGLSDEIPLDEVAEEITPLDEIKMPKNDTVNEKNSEINIRKSVSIKFETNQLPQGKGSFGKFSGLEQTEHKSSTAMETKECDENIEKQYTSSPKSEEIVVKSSKRLSRKGRKGRGRPPGKSPASVERDVELTPPLPIDTCIKIKEEPDLIEEKYIKNEQDKELEVNINIKLEEDIDPSIIKHVEESATIDNTDQILEKGEDDSLMSENDVNIQDSLSQDEVASPQQLSSNEEPSISEDKYQPSSSITDSIPNSPASTAPSDDQETLREYKVWKKAIMLVWRAAANHKFANVFLHPVTNDVAPGYHSIVYRPMDLSVIKKNIENGVIRSTIEFQRDMMLMFQNAIMYNSSDHDVYHMALEMQKEVMEQIQDFLATQLMLQTAESKVLRGRERETRERKTESTDKDEDLKRKRSSTSASEGEPKTKKRKA